MNPKRMNPKLIVIEDESKKKNRKAKNSCSKTPQKDAIKSSPFSKPNNPCTLCKTTNTASHRTLHGHCGSKIVLIKGFVQATIEPWENSKYWSLSKTTEVSKFRLIQFLSFYQTNVRQTQTQYLPMPASHLGWLKQCTKKICNKALGWSKWSNLEMT